MKGNTTWLKKEITFLWEGKLIGMKMFLQQYSMWEECVRRNNLNERKCHEQLNMQPNLHQNVSKKRKEANKSLKMKKNPINESVGQ